MAKFLFSITFLFLTPILIIYSYQQRNLQNVVGDVSAQTPLLTPQYVTPTLYCIGSCPGVPTPIESGPTVSPTVTEVPISSTVTSEPSTSISPLPTEAGTELTSTPDPCATSTVSSENEVAHRRYGRRHRIGGGLLQLLFRWFLELLNLFLRLIGQNPLPVPTEPIVTPTPIESGPTPFPSLLPSGSPTPTPDPCLTLTPTTPSEPIISITTPVVSVTTAAPTPTITPTGTQVGRVYPWHTNIVATTFWVGEIFNENLSDGSQVCSAYDSDWAYHWSGVNNGVVPAGSAGCSGSIVGGCDGIAGANNSCSTEARTSSNDYFPTQVTPKENPFYVTLPFDDLNDNIAFQARCQVILWANDAGFAGHCSDQSFSYMKNRWVRTVGPNGNTCYGQIEDAGPSHDDLYHDSEYVFGSDDKQPIQGQFNNAGMDVSPALNGCLGFSDIDGDSDKIKWQFVDDVDVPAGPWKKIITSSPVYN